MSRHETQGGSLQDWINHELSHLAEQNQDDSLGTDLGDRNLSLRVPLALHLMLSRLAEKLGRSKSAVSEEVLTRAVRDAYKQFDLPPLTRADLEDYAAQAETSPLKSAPAAKKSQRG